MKDNKNVYKSAVDEIKIDTKLLNATALEMMQRKENRIKNRTNIRTKNVYRYGIIAACVLVLVVSVFFLKDQLNPSPIAKQPAVDKTVYPAHFTPNTTITLADGRGKLFINEIDRVSASKLLVPDGSYSKDLSMSQLTEYFGRNPIPVIPNGFTTAGDTFNIMFKADGSIFYMNGVQLTKDINDLKSPSISVQLNKGAMPKNDCFYKGDSEKESTIGSTKLIIGSLKMGEEYSAQGIPASYYDVYYSQFMYQGIGYNISAQRVSVDTFMELLQGIIK